MTAMLDVLNPNLYRRLLRRFGEVRITHPGEKRVARMVRNLEDELRLYVRQHGETYRVCCPFCKDSFFQLTINHMYGQRDSDSGRQLLNLAFCHSNNCLAVYANRVKLADMLSAHDGWLEDVRILPGKLVSDEERKIELPRPMTRLDKLPARHPARKGLVERGLDPDRLGKAYKVSYCAENDEPVARDRIIIPIVMRGQLRGWQSMPVRAGSIGGRIIPSRYLSAPGMESAKLLYNFDRARQYQTAVLVKGPADVWTFGPMALCAVSSRVSEYQEQTLRSVFREATLVLLLYEMVFSRPDVRRLVSELRPSLRFRLAVVRLPESDPAGQYNRAVLREHVVKEAAKQGVRVCYDKREQNGSGRLITFS